jgi:hypothetical protein
MCFSSASAPEPEPIQKPAEYSDPSVTAARTDNDKRQRAAAGAQSTILSRLMAPLGGGGSKTLMGQ